MNILPTRQIRFVSKAPRLPLACATLVLLAVTACGGNGPAGVAVRVGTSTVDATAVGHWMAVIAAGASTSPGQPTPKPPDPPSYTACISYLRAWAPWAKAAGGRPAVGSARLRAQCEYEYEKLKLKALVTLISFAWVRGEAAELGVRTSEAQVTQRFALLKAQFPNPAALNRFLATRGVTVADLLEELRESVLVAAIQQKIEGEGEQRRLTTAQRQQALERFGQAFLAKWVAKTDCQAGYMVTLCRQYRSSKEPFGLKPPAVPLTNMTTG